MERGSNGSRKNIRTAFSWWESRRNTRLPRRLVWRAAGLKPVVAVYSSFLQRAYDQVIHDVCIQNLPVVFCVDRAGLVGSDGETHQGIFDLTFLSSVPNMSVMAPKNRWELEKMLQFAISYDGPIAIRYPRGEAYRGLRNFWHRSSMASARCCMRREGRRFWQSEAWSARQSISGRN